MIKGGEIYGCYIYAGTGDGSYAEMSETGLDVYVKDDKGNWSQKIGIGYYSGNYDYPYIILGAGTNKLGENTGCVYKLASGLWIGDASIVNAGGEYPGDKTSASDISTNYKNATGIFIDLVGDKIYKYIKGVPYDISVATFG
jgi:hypothetical protein